MLASKRDLFALNNLCPYIFCPSIERYLKSISRPSLADHVAEDYSSGARLLVFFLSEAAAIEIDEFLQFGSDQGKVHVVSAKGIAVEEAVHPISYMKYLALWPWRSRISSIASRFIILFI